MVACHKPSFGMLRRMNKLSGEISALGRARNAQEYYTICAHREQTVFLRFSTWAHPVQSKMLVPHLCTGVFTGISLGNENSRRKSQKVEARPPIPGFITRTGLYDTGVIPHPAIWVGLSLEMDPAWTIISQVVGLQPLKDEFVHTCFCMHLAAVGKSPWFHGCSAGARVEPSSPLIAVLCFISQVY